MSSVQRLTTRVVPIPKDKVGLVIGRKGSRLQEIRDQTGVYISIKDNQAHLRGTEEQCQDAKTMIEETLTRAHDKRGGFKKLDVKIPEKFMGFVIGRGREKLNDIETRTGVALKVIDNHLHIKGSTEQEKKVIREVKATVNLGMKRSLRVEPLARFCYVDTAQLKDDHEFELHKIRSEEASSIEKSFQLRLLEHPLEEEKSDFADTDSLIEKILGVLKQIHKEKEEGEMVKVDMWSHFGHAHISRIDEEEEEQTFTLNEIKHKLESTDGKSWKLSFKEGVEKIEVEEIEKNLTSCSATEDIRHDFTFYTPSCRDIRVKVWLEEEHSKEEGAAEPSLVFSRFAPIPVKNVLTRVLSEEETGDTSDTPNFHMCSQFHHRMRAEILMPSKGFDCRLSIRTCSNIPKTPEVEEEDMILESYLNKMKLDGSQLRLPPVTELPEGFDLFYQRRSLRRTYQYEMEGEKFTLTVCKEQAKHVDIDHTDDSVYGLDETEPKPDIHLHCEEWDQKLDEGSWEPEQIVAKLPSFLKFLRKVQRNVAPQDEASDQ
ncbi:uncharacterized protein LOC111340448 isoform X1 [Stylophora pistillata]|uniref:uncharacterized protein LOC111340448 isoform X1 n=1 Tax=Stylophora pistillata TaxID=50429 RepID=UPI000C04A39E|nr:uncharacterized protein LOC111340448 isoform X1 [Stylophora pistillata]